MKYEKRSLRSGSKERMVIMLNTFPIFSRVTPVLSLTLTETSLFQDNVGLYSTTPEHSTHPVAVDFFSPSVPGNTRFSAKATVMREKGSVNETSLKQTLQLNFSRNPDGSVTSPLFEESAQEGAVNVSSFTNLRLRAALHESFAIQDYPNSALDTGSSSRARATYIKDWWVAETQREMLAALATDNPGLNLPPVPRRRLVHLYLNGMYWGVYELMEELDAQFLKDHFGSGFDSDSFAGIGKWPAAYRDNGPVQYNYANADLWLQTSWYARVKSFGVSLPANLETFFQSNYSALGDVFSIEAFFDYVLLNIFINNEDWPLRFDTFVSHSYTPAQIANGEHVDYIPDLFSPDLGSTYAIPKTGGIYQKGVFLATNAERSFAPWSASDPSPWDALLGPEPYRKPQWHLSGTPGEFGYYTRALAYFPENRTLLRERIDHLFGEGGVLSHAAGRERLYRLYTEMSQVIRAETTRWGHSAVPGGNGPNFYTDKDWQNAVFWMRDSFFGGDAGVSELPPQGAERSFVPASLPRIDPATGGIADEDEDGDGWLPPVGGGGGGGERPQEIDKDAPADPSALEPGEPGEQEEPSAPEEFDRDDEVSVIAYLPGTKSAPGAAVTPPADKTKKYVSLILGNDDNDDEDPVPPEEGEEWPRDNDEETDELAEITENDDDIVKVDLNIAGALSNLSSNSGDATINTSNQSASVPITSGAITNGQSSNLTLVTLTIPEGVRPFDDTGEFLKEEDRSFFVETVSSSNPLSGLASAQTVSIYVEGLEEKTGGSIILRVVNFSADVFETDGGGGYGSTGSSGSNGAGNGPSEYTYGYGGNETDSDNSGDESSDDSADDSSLENGVVLIPIRFVGANLDVEGRAEKNEQNEMTWERECGPTLPRTHDLRLNEFTDWFNRQDMYRGGEQHDIAHDDIDTEQNASVIDDHYGIRGLLRNSVPELSPKDTKNVTAAVITAPENTHLAPFVNVDSILFKITIPAPGIGSTERVRLIPVTTGEDGAKVDGAVIELPIEEIPAGSGIYFTQNPILVYEDENNRLNQQRLLNTQQIPTDTHLIKAESIKVQWEPEPNGPPPAEYEFLSEKLTINLGEGSAAMLRHDPANPWPAGTTSSTTTQMATAVTTGQTVAGTALDPPPSSDERHFAWINADDETPDLRFEIRNGNGTKPGFPEGTSIRWYLQYRFRAGSFDWFRIRLNGNRGSVWDVWQWHCHTESEDVLRLQLVNDLEISQDDLQLLPPGDYQLFARVRFEAGTVIESNLIEFNILGTNPGDMGKRSPKSLPPTISQYIDTLIPIEVDGDTRSYSAGNLDFRNYYKAMLAHESGGAPYSFRQNADQFERVPESFSQGVGFSRSVRFPISLFRRSDFESERITHEQVTPRWHARFGFPLVGGDNGWGLSQQTGSNNKFNDCMRWKRNVLAGWRELRTKVPIAVRYLKSSNVFGTSDVEQIPQNCIIYETAKKYNYGNQYAKNGNSVISNPNKITHYVDEISTLYPLNNDNQSSAPILP